MTAPEEPGHDGYRLAAGYAVIVLGILLAFWGAFFAYALFAGYVLRLALGADVSDWEWIVTAVAGSFAGMVTYLGFPMKKLTLLGRRVRTKKKRESLRRAATFLAPPLVALVVFALIGSRT